MTFSGPVPFLDTSGVLALSTPMYDAYKGEYIDLEPGTNIEVRDNHIVGNYPYQGWYMSGIDIEVNGSALVEGNDVEVASSSGIALWWPTDGGCSCATAVGHRRLCAGNVLDANHNELRANNVNNLRPRAWPGVGRPASIPPAEILLLSNGNRVIGGGNHEPGVTVLDFGTDNHHRYDKGRWAAAQCGGAIDDQQRARSEIGWFGCRNWMGRAVGLR